MSKKEEILHKLNTEDRNYIKEKFKEKDEEIKILKKALELTNQHITFCPAKQGECGCLKDKSKKCSYYFLNKAKEMLKDE